MKIGVQIQYKIEKSERNWNYKSHCAAAVAAAEARFSIPLYIDARWLFFHANGSFFNAYILCYCSSSAVSLLARRNFKLQFSIIFSMQAR